MGDGCWVGARLGVGVETGASVISGVAWPDFSEASSGDDKTEWARRGEVAEVDVADAEHCDSRKRANPKVSQK